MASANGVLSSSEDIARLAHRERLGKAVRNEGVTSEALMSKRQRAAVLDSKSVTARLASRSRFFVVKPPCTTATTVEEPPSTTAEPPPAPLTAADFEMTDDDEAPASSEPAPTKRVAAMRQQACETAEKAARWIPPPS